MNASSRSYLPAKGSLPTYSAVVPGNPSPALPSATSSHMSPNLSRASNRSPNSATDSSCEAYRDGSSGSASNVGPAMSRAYSGTSSAKATAAASLHIARIQHETGFPYGISGVAMPNYSYGSDLYSYVSNGFPRKSRVCSYCSKIFTRSTTRRYHEKRCPLLRAAGSLMKGGTDPDSITVATSTSNSNSDGKCLRRNINHSQPPPSLIAVSGNLSPSQTSNTSQTSPTSLETAAMTAAASRMLNSPSLYSLYGSHHYLPFTTTASTTSLSSATAASSLDFDQNRNSVLTVKQENDQTFDVRGTSCKLGAVVTKDNTGKELELGRKYRTRGEHGQHMLSPLLATSASPSQMSPASNEDARGEVMDGLRAGGPVPFPSPDKLVMKDVSKRYHQHDLKPAYNPHPEAMIVSTSSLTAKMRHSQISPDLISEDDDQVLREDEGHVNMKDADESEPIDVRPSTIGKEKAHSNSRTENKQCGLCSKVFQSKKEFRDHERQHLRYKPSCCRFCGQRFLKPHMRMAHERLHVAWNPWTCVVCGERFWRKFGLRTHVHCFHTGISLASSRLHKCRYCHQNVESIHLSHHFRQHSIPKDERESLRYLISIKSAPSSPVDEMESVEDLPHPSSLESGESRHSPACVKSDPPHLIDVKPMPDSAEHLGLMEEAELQSKNRLPYDSAGVLNNADCNTPQVNGGRTTPTGAPDKEWCRLCEKEYPKSFMRNHERFHADQKPYECPLCHKRFGYKNNMKSHMKLHQGIKPYRCQVCGAKFTRGSTLRRHARRHGISTDAIWDLFVQNGGATKQQPSTYSDKMPLLAHAADPNTSSATKPRSHRLRTEVIIPTHEPSVGAKTEGGGNSDAVTTSGSFDQRSVTQSASASQNMFASFAANLPTVSQNLYHQPYMNTGQMMGYTPSYSPTQTQAVQSDALNLSLPDRQRRNSSPSSSSTIPLSSPYSTQCAPGSSRQFLAAEEDQSPRQHFVGKDDVDEDDMEDHWNENRDHVSGSQKLTRGMEYRTETRDLSKSPCSIDYNAQSTLVGVQTSPNANREIASLLNQSTREVSSFNHNTSREVTQLGHNTRETPAFHDRMAREASSRFNHSSRDMTPHPFNHSSREVSNLDLTGGALDMTSGSKRMSLTSNVPLLQESIASLLSTGRMFGCVHCEIYFTDRTMYRIHQKFHLPNDHPFVCSTCGEDCQDKVSFSLHLYEHLR